MENQARICPECLTTLYIAQAHCYYCGAPETKETVEILLSKHDKQQTKVLVYAIVGLLVLGGALFALDHFLPALCESCGQAITGYSVASNNEIAFLDAAFNPGFPN